MVFLSPFDVGYALCLATPIQLILYTIEEFARAKKVYAGVAMAAAVYPNSMLAMAVVGMLKGKLHLGCPRRLGGSKHCYYHPFIFPVRFHLL